MKPDPNKAFTLNRGVDKSKTRSIRPLIPRSNILSGDSSSLLHKPGAEDNFTVLSAKVETDLQKLGLLLNDLVEHYTMFFLAKHDEEKGATSILESDALEKGIKDLLSKVRELDDHSSKHFQAMNLVLDKLDGNVHKEKLASLIEKKGDLIFAILNAAKTGEENAEDTLRADALDSISDAA